MMETDQGMPDLIRMAILLHMMQGTPYIYQGEEIGMTNANFTNLTQYKDIDSLNAYHQLVEVEKTVSHEDMIRYLRKSSRDHARTPMQWDNTSHAGFSHHAPWIEVNPNYKDIIKDKYTSIKGKLAVKYLEFTSFLCDSVGEDTCNQAKEDFNAMKESFGFTWDLIKELASSSSNKIKEFYESWRDSE